jgi:hypothetical protein
MTDTPKTEDAKTPAAAPATPGETPPGKPKEIAKEIGGPKGPEPTRFGDWEKNGRCIDF